MSWKKVGLMIDKKRYFAIGIWRFFRAHLKIMLIFYTRRKKESPLLFFSLLSQGPAVYMVGPCYFSLSIKFYVRLRFWRELWLLKKIKHGINIRGREFTIETGTDICCRLII